MNENISNNNNNVRPANGADTPIDLIPLLNALWRRLWLIVLAVVAGGCLLYSYTYFMVSPTYRASAMLFVNGSSLSLGSTSINLSNMNTAQSLVDRYIVILKTRGTLEAVIERADLPYSYGALRGMISANSVNDTEIFEVSVVSSKPEEAKLIANTIAEVLPERIKSIMEVSAVQVVDYAVTPQWMEGPNYTSSAIKGGLLGAVLCAGLIVLFELLDTKIHSEDYLLSQYPDVPLLTVIPTLGHSGSSSKYYAEKGGYYGKTAYK